MQSFVTSVDQATRVINLEEFEVMRDRDVEASQVVSAVICCIDHYPEPEESEAEDTFRVKFNYIEECVDIHFCGCWESKIQEFLNDHEEEFFLNYDKDNHEEVEEQVIPQEDRDLLDTDVNDLTEENMEQDISDIDKESYRQYPDLSKEEDDYKNENDYNYMNEDKADYSNSNID